MTFSACRTTTTVVDLAVTKSHAAVIRTSTPTTQVKAANPMGAKNGRRCRFAGILMAR
jgi:hypothetical protein